MTKMSPPCEVAPAGIQQAGENLDVPLIMHEEVPVGANIDPPIGVNVEVPIGADMPERLGEMPAGPQVLRPNMLQFDAEEGPGRAPEVQMTPQIPLQPAVPMSQEKDPVDLFLSFLEGNMDGTTSNKMVCAPECLRGTEVGEGVPSKQVMILSPSRTTVIEADDEDLSIQGLKPYPHAYLTTQHILSLTKSLAIMHAQELAKNKQTKNAKEVPNNSLSRNSKASKTMTKENTSTNPELPQTQPGYIHVDILKDKWTAQVTNLETVDTNMEILVEVLKHANSSPRTITKLEALRSDLPTLTQFLQFASSIQTRLVPCIGPIGINDIYINENEEGEAISMAVRLRAGDEDMKGPFLRDISWLWLTLLEATTLSNSYMELCNEYCSSFNKIFSHLIQSGECEEISYFDVMRDLGENFLHAFLTIVHKFVISNTWFFDRRLHTADGLSSLVDIFSFLVDNGIVGSIFVM